MAKTLRELTIKLDTDVAELKKGLAKANKQLTRFQKKTKAIGAGLKNAFSVVAIVAAGRAVINFAGEISTLGKELEGVQNGFKGIDPQILQDVKTATRGTVTELNLMKRLNIAKSFNLPLKEMGTLFEFVHREARRTGQSVDKLTDVLILGLGRESKLRIDDLGISVSQMNEQLKKTPDFTTAVATIMKQRMAETGEYIETAADITERWAADWENMKAEVGLFINKGIKLIAPVIDDLRKDMEIFFKDSGKWLLDTINFWIDLYNEAVIFRAIINAIKMTFKTVWITIKAFFKATTAGVKTVGKLFKLLFDPSQWGKGFGEKLKKIIGDGFDAVKMDVKEAANDYAQMLKDGLGDMRKHVDPLKWNDLADTEEIKEKAKKTGQDAGKELTKGLKKTVKEGIEAWQIPAPRIEPFEADTAAVKETIKGIEDVAFELNSVNNFIASSFSLLGENIGSGLSDIESFSKKFMSILLDFAAQFGKILIATGVAALGLKNIFANPFVGIAAGVALVALAGAAKNLLAEGPKFAQGGIVGGSSFSHDRVPIMAKSGEMVLNNRQQANMFRQINGGGTSKGGVLTARVSGSDLLFILNEAERTNNNSF